MIRYAMTNPRLLTAKNSGFSLVELLVAMTIGLLLLAGLSIILFNSSQTNRELKNNAQQIENGRYASDILAQDLRHAGFYGRLYLMPAPPAGTADPCEVAATAALTSAMAWPVQGYRAADLATRADITTTSCGAGGKNLLTNANLAPGSDVLVIRRAHTTALPTASASIINELYIQTTGTASQVRVGTGAAFGPAGLFNKDGTQAPVRKYVVHVYFVAPCSNGNGADGVCAAGDDAIPTLKRLELVSEGGATIMKIVPIVEGIEYFKIEYGVDTLPAAVNSITNLRGDATVDTYTPTPTDWTDVIATKVYLLARHLEPSMGHVDNKSYVLGSVTVAPSDYAGREAFKRHAYTASTRIVNAAGRREVP